MSKPVLAVAAFLLSIAATLVAAGEVKDEQILKEVFGRAHLAMSGHHFGKASAALKQKNWALSANYLRSAASHFQRASSWTGRELRPDTQSQIGDAIKSAEQTGAEEEAKRISELIQFLRTRLEAFRSTSEAASDSTK